MRQQLISGFVPRFSVGLPHKSLWVALLSELGCFNHKVVFEVSEFTAYLSYPEELAVRESLLTVKWMCRVERKIVVAVDQIGRC